MRRTAPSLFVVLLIMVVTITISVRELWKEPYSGMADRLVRSDVKGYYGYLQALFIRHDLGSEAYQWEYVRHTPGGTLNKYFSGTAVMMAPWFAIGHDIALGDSKAPRDGLSVHEMRALSIGAWVYSLIGLLALRALLHRMGMHEGVVSWTLLGIGLGTQLIQYAALQPGWSHIYSFCCVALFLLNVHKVAHGAPMRWLVFAAMLLGLIVLIRPVNGLMVLAVPVLLGDRFVPFLRRIIRHPFVLSFAVIAGGMVVFVQPLLWHAQTGQWLAYGYEGEGFHWGRPEVVKVLFGFRRGLFLWTPVLLLALGGTLLLLKRERARGAWLLLYWAANLYVISAWWIWYYGSGFGARVFIDHYPALALPAALLLQRASGRWWTLARVFITCCCALLLFQMWQYNNHILHHESMDRAKYMHTFLRWDDRYRGQLGGNYQAPPFNPNGMSVVLEESCDFEHACTHWGGAGLQHTRIAFSGSNAAMFNELTEFGLGFNARAGELPTGRALYMEVGLQRMSLRSGGSASLLAVTDVVREDGSHAYYEPFRMDPLPATTGCWEQVEYRIPVPALAEGDRLAFYFWNQDRRALVAIDDVFMRISAVEPY